MNGTLAAFYEGIAVGHVEAGLRTYDKRQPFPEEINRRLCTQLADLHFAPTARSRRNLLVEQVPDERLAGDGRPTRDSAANPYGDARAAERIVAAIADCDLGAPASFRPPPTLPPRRSPTAAQVPDDRSFVGELSHAQNSKRAD